MLLNKAANLVIVFLASLRVRFGQGTEDTTNSTVREHVDILAPVPLTGTWSGGRTMMLSALIAEDLINEEQVILPGYTLKNHFFDDRCDAQHFQEIVLGETSSSDMYVAVGGAGCDEVCRQSSFVPHSMRMPFLSYECAGSALSSQIDFPGLTRMGTTRDDSIEKVIGRLKDMYDFSHIAIITGDPARYGAKAQSLETSMQAMQLGTDRFSVFKNSETLLDDITSIFQTLKKNKRRVVYVLADESLYRKFICGFIRSGANKGITWLSDGTWRHQWWKKTDTLVAYNMRWIQQDALSPTLRLFFPRIKQAWDEYGATDDIRRKGLQASYVTDQKEFLDMAHGSELYHSVHKEYHPTYRALLYDRDYYDIFVFDLKGNLIYSVFKELDFATNFMAGGGGQWATSGLGDAFNLALQDPHGLSRTPWAPYGPSAGALASFLATGIFDVNGDLIGVYSIQFNPSAMSIEDTEEQCSLERIEDNFEGAINIAGHGRPTEEELDKPLSCFQNHTARTFHELIQKHMEEGYPSGNVETSVSEPYFHISGNAADATCVFALSIKYLFDEGYTLEQIRKPSREMYSKFNEHIKEHIGFDGVTGRVEFRGNDKFNTIRVEQVRKESAMNPIVVGLLPHGGELSLSVNGGPTNASWRPAYVEPPPPDNFPYMPFQIAIPTLIVFIPACAGIYKGLRPAT